MSGGRKKQEYRKVDWKAYHDFKAGESSWYPVDVLQDFSGRRILEIGCGTGSRLSAFESADLRVGIETERSPFGARARADPRRGFLPLAALGESLPFRDGTFDTVWMIEVIEHLPDPRRVLSEVSRVLSPKGLVLIQTPNYPIKRLYDVKNWLRTRGRSTWRDDPTHVTKLSWRALRRMVESSFVVERSRTRNILGESLVPALLRARAMSLGIALGQKTILVARKMEGR